MVIHCQEEHKVTTENGIIKRPSADVFVMASLRKTKAPFTVDVFASYGAFWLLLPDATLGKFRNQEKKLLKVQHQSCVLEVFCLFACFKS